MLHACLAQSGHFIWWSYQSLAAAARPHIGPETGHNARVASRQFAGALADLDDIPLTYQHTQRRSRLSVSKKECNCQDDGCSEIDAQFKAQREATRDSSASGSTLKVLDCTPERSNAGNVEQGQPLPPGPPRAIGFWHQALKETRKIVFLKYSRTLSILCLFVLSVLSIYWGVLFRVKQNQHNITIAVVNFDGQIPPYQDTEPLVGPAVLEAAQAELLKPDALGFQTRHPATYNYDPLTIRLAIQHDKLWGAIVINANATSLLRSAFLNGNASYDPPGVAQLIYNQARDIESYNQYITPVLTRLVSDVTASFGRRWTSIVLNNNTYSSSTQSLSPAIGFSVFNLRPFDPSIAIPAVSIGLIDLIIIAFFSFSFFIPTHPQFIPSAPTTHIVLKFHHLIVWRYLATLTAYLLLSLCYSFISLLFLIPFSHSPTPGGPWPKTDVTDNANPYGHATWPIYWILNFFRMAALGLACENVAMVVGAPWTALWLIFWVITNVTTGFYALELAPAFYAWGYVWPLRQIVYASRTLLLGTHDRLGYNFGILVLLDWSRHDPVSGLQLLHEMEGDAGEEESCIAGGEWNEIKYPIFAHCIGVSRRVITQTGTGKQQELGSRAL